MIILKNNLGNMLRLTTRQTSYYNSYLRTGLIVSNIKCCHTCKNMVTLPVRKQWILLKNNGADIVFASLTYLDSFNIHIELYLYSLMYFQKMVSTEAVKYNINSAKGNGCLPISLKKYKDRKHTRYNMLAKS